MQHFDAVERVLLRDPRVYRVFVTPERFYFIYIGSIVRVDSRILSELEGLSPDEMLKRSAFNYSLSLAEIGEPELFSAHFLLGHGLFWRFKIPTGKRHTFALHQWGDMTVAAAVLLWALPGALSRAKVDPTVQPVLEQAAQRAAQLQTTAAESMRSGRSEEVQVVAKTSSAPTYQSWRHSRTRFVQVVLFLAVLASVLLRYGCR